MEAEPHKLLPGGMAGYGKCKRTGRRDVHNVSLSNESCRTSPESELQSQGTPKRGDPGKVERALSETGLVRQFGRDFRVDKVRRQMEHRADKRQKYAGHALFLVPRWTNGPDMLQ
ncbi:uncharacterized protein LOC111674207, partial [Orussus abietinus]|uniref:uncharacterized protein LOC111674207 n=1 Tax=Orussus abietinus TaxID=222816 RepID=UPI000C715E87